MSSETGGDATGAPSCSRHLGVRATGTCVRCLSAFCDVCSGVSLDGSVCVRCVARGLRRASAIRVAVVSAAAAVAVVASPFVYRAIKAPAGDEGTASRLTQDGKDAKDGKEGKDGKDGQNGKAGKKGAPPVLTGKAAELSAALDSEPCDREKIIRLCEALLGAGEPRYCLTRSDEFFARCGDFWRLRWLTYEAHKRLSEWDPAIAEVTRLVTQFPDDKDYVTWRGLAYEEKADYAHAAADYEQAIAIEPRLASIPFNLASAYRQLGRPCDAIFPLEQVSFYYPDRDGNARRRLRELYDDPKCAERMGTGKATIRFGVGARRVTAQVTLNHAQPAKLIVDTGASTVIISARLAARLGLAFERWPTQRAATANGIRDVRIGFIDEVAVQGVSARHVECAVIDDLADADGLLGLSFLARFEMHADASKGVLTLVDRRVAAR